MLNERGLILACLANTRETLNETLNDTMVVFWCGDQCYGVSSHIVHAIQPLGDYTPLPFTPSYILGLAKRQGQAVVVIDVRPPSLRASIPPPADACIVIVGLEGIDIGLLANTVCHMAPRKEKKR
jgi:purine-binding chemotaxis protein CheW